MATVERKSDVISELILDSVIGSGMQILVFVALLAAFTSGCSATPVTKLPETSWLLNHNMLAVDESGGADIRRVKHQLTEYSHKDFPVLVTAPRSFDWGQAHIDHAIIFDPREDTDKNIAAYRLAHEWGHEALDHEPTMYSPDGQTYKFRRSTEKEESEADLFAGDFLAQYGYSIEAVCRQLDSYSAIPWDSRSAGAVRCQRAKDGFNRAMAKIEAGRKQAKADRRSAISDFGPNGS